VDFALTTPGPLVVDDTVATVEGTGWVDVREIRLDGSDTPLAVAWSAPSGRVADTWRATIPVPYGAHTFTLVAYDFRGTAIKSATIQIESTVSSRPLEEFLRISELHYHPQDSEDWEFVELTNISSGDAAVPLDLSGVTMTAGPSEPFRFPDDTILPAGEQLLIVGDRDAFLARYPHVPASQIAGQFAGNLDNGGERITLVGADGTPLIDFTYDDSSPWPPEADGQGPSLELVRPAATSRADQANPAAWRGSSRPGGSPGQLSSAASADFDANGTVDAADVDRLFLALRAAETDLRFDITGDGRLDELDRDQMIHGVLGTMFGDTNLDLRFNSSDLVAVFQAGEYEDGIAGNSTWQEGDWNGDGDFSTADLVLAFQDGGYVARAIALVADPRTTSVQARRPAHNRE
jgi:hypothetical protein